LFQVLGTDTAVLEQTFGKLAMYYKLHSSRPTLYYGKIIARLLDLQCAAKK